MTASEQTLGVRGQPGAKAKSFQMQEHQCAGKECPLRVCTVGRLACTPVLALPVLSISVGDNARALHLVSFVRHAISTRVNIFICFSALRFLFNVPLCFNF